MDRLSLVLHLMIGATLTGVLIIVAFTFNWYGWWPIVVAAVIGFGAGYPLSYMISRRIKGRDPLWQERREDERRRAARESGPPEA